VLLRYVNAGVFDSSLGALGLRQTLLGRNASPYVDPQTLVAPLVGPGETADVAVDIPADASAGQRYSIMDQGRQMDHGDAAGFGGALTFIDVWAGAATAPTITGLAFDPSTNMVSGTANPSAAAFPVTLVEWSTDNFATVAGSDAGPAVTGFAAHVPVTAETTISFRATDTNSLVSPVTDLHVTPGAPTLNGLAYDLASGHLTGTATPWDSLIPVTKVEWSTDHFTTVGGNLTAATISSFDFAVSLTAPATVSVRAIDAGGKTVSVDVAVAPAAPTAIAAFDGSGNITAIGTATTGLNIVGAEYFVGATDPGAGLATAMTGALPGNPVTNLTATPATPFNTGDVISVRVEDSFGQWSPVVTVTA
jgi:hypothetical protein